MILYLLRFLDMLNTLDLVEIENKLVYMKLNNKLIKKVLTTI